MSSPASPTVPPSAAQATGAAPPVPSPPPAPSASPLLAPPTPPSPSSSPPPPASPRRWPLLLRMAVLAALVVLVFIVVDNWERWVGGADQQRTDDAYLQTDITPLGAKVAGYVVDAPAGDFAPVRQGELLVALRPDDYQAQLAQQEASVAAAQAALVNNGALAELQQANIRAARAAADGAAAVLGRSRREAARQRRLLDDGSGTDQARDTAETSERQNGAQLEQGRAQVAAAERQLAVLAAQRAQAEAALAAAQAAHEQAVLNLGYTRIVAPSDGVTGQRQVRLGQYVSIGQQVAVLAALPRIWVIANFKETQIRNMRVGQPCTVTVDAFPGHALRGHVVAFAPGTGSQFALLPPDNATGNFTKVVQRVGVKIAIDDPGDLREQLRPGLSVVASVRTGS